MCGGMICTKNISKSAYGRKTGPCCSGKYELHFKKIKLHMKSMIHHSCMANRTLLLAFWPKTEGDTQRWSDVHKSTCQPLPLCSGAIRTSPCEVLTWTAIWRKTEVSCLLFVSYLHTPGQKTAPPERVPDRVAAQGTHFQPSKSTKERKACLPQQGTGG